jgi:AcrR family transcriptional regulator
MLYIPLQMAELIKAAADTHQMRPSVALDGQPRWEERSAVRMLEARRERALDRSRQIVEAAYRLLEDGGLEGVTIRAVLSKTGLSRRAFYERFADKDELMLAVFEEVMRVAARTYRAQMRTVREPMERLRLIVICVVLGKSSLDAPGSSSGSLRGAGMSREHLRLAQLRPQDLQAALSPLLTLIAQQLADGMRTGSVRQDDSQRLASLIYNLVATTVHTELLTQQSSQPDWPRRLQLAGDIWEFCRRAIAAS